MILIDTKNPMKNSLVHNMCTQRRPYNYSERIYIAQNEWMQNYVQHSLIPPIESTRARGGRELLKELQLSWKKFQRVQSLFCKYFKYLDRSYVKHRELKSIQESAIQIFRSSLGENSLDEAAAEVFIGDIVQFIDNTRGEEDGNSMDAYVIENIKIFDKLGRSVCYRVVSK